MIGKFKNSNLPYILISLACSLALFFNVNSQSVSRVFNSNLTYQEALQNVPVTLNYDSDEYFVHGFAATVSVKLSSANRIQLNREADEDTRAFSVVADLENLSAGTHEVKLQAHNLQSSIVATIEPQTISVTIEKKQTKTFDVTPVLSNTTDNDDMQIDNLTVNPERVEITTGEETMKQIDRVIATVDASKLTGEESSLRAQVQALNANGEALAIQAEPQNVVVSFQSEMTSKEVTLLPRQEGTTPDDVERYQIELDRSVVTIRGIGEAINTVESIELPVNISGITQATRRMIDVPAGENYEVNPTSVAVRITPIMADSGETTESSTQQPNESTSEIQGSETTQSSSIQPDGSGESTTTTN
ncbi:hypothetical protein NRIC_23730 [Enterococcus florum]|uniref:YbbR-like protein n=1 Tax=Enterococcus florum TaxID=2480627 RepID=A0A4P5PFQ6_9ENTE|nr:CdaR family protein [Enterococcus florum]GCF94482.1 hypothetical protein NRIC_23730 [Enterococcus florum]